MAETTALTKIVICYHRESVLRAHVSVLSTEDLRIILEVAKDRSAEVPEPQHHLVRIIHGKAEELTAWLADYPLANILSLAQVAEERVMETPEQPPSES